MDQPDRIHLRDYVLAADIGAFQTERGQDQRLRFNLTVDLALPVIGVDDEVDRILSYDILTGAIEAGLADRRYNLLETLAEKIAAQVLEHPRAAQVEVTATVGAIDPETSTARIDLAVVVEGQRVLAKAQALVRLAA